CSEKGWQEKWAGNKTSDAVCMPHGLSHTPVALLLALGILLLVCATGAAYLIKKRKSSREDSARKRVSTIYESSSCVPHECSFFLPLHYEI
ncbi:hypothetical protein lerEdw1_019679, partial [Lerista edwardsae]